ncbi:MAG: lycopene cyclase domain-containing protein [Gemmatimonadota bacterium]|nr:lycopene cyclase domain-containing protein [Gemmatimonadota bacterium]
MNHHYVWLLWSSAFLVPWLVLFLATPRLRAMMWRTSLATSLLGLTEPLFVPEYWNPPSVFELARRTGFDIESFIFAFAVGGIGTALYHGLAHHHLVRASAEARRGTLHRFHRAALIIPLASFVPLYFLPWNPIYPSITVLGLGALGSVLCRPELRTNTVIGGLLFLGLYAAFMLGLKWLAPGYIVAVWNLSALQGGLVYGIPLEELLFGFTFGLYWTGVYEHFTWSESVANPELRIVLSDDPVATAGSHRFQTAWRPEQPTAEHDQ